MIATMRRAGFIALAAGFIAGPALADSVYNAAPAQAAGSTAYSGSTRSPSGIDNTSASDVRHSVGALPAQNDSADATNPPNATHSKLDAAPRR